MYLQTFELKRYPELQRLVRAAFPGYKKHKVFVSTFNGASINSCWDGGSRDVHAIVELSTMRQHPLPTSTHPYFDMARNGLANTTDQFVSVDRVGNVRLEILPEGFALVTAGTTMGKPATAHIRFNAADLTPAITEGK